MGKMILLVVAASLLSSHAFSAKPICKTTSSGTPLVQYTGTVRQLYVNSGNLILLYFDESIAIVEAADCGFTITNGTAASYGITENTQFAGMFYSTALAAQVSQKQVTIQMSGVKSGYMKFDRIWLLE